MVTLFTSILVLCAFKPTLRFCIAAFFMLPFLYVESYFSTACKLLFIKTYAKMNKCKYQCHTWSSEVIYQSSFSVLFRAVDNILQVSAYDWRSALLHGILWSSYWQNYSYSLFLEAYLYTETTYSYRPQLLQMNQQITLWEKKKKKT